ncbi:MAG: nucleotide exchange factor GrpE [Candidatus Micrarchaeaceae archaeon]
MAEEKKEEQKNEAEGKKDAKQQEAKALEEIKNSEAYKELFDRYLRLAAEFDNYKKRAAKDAESIKTLAKAELVKKILPTIDEIEIAIDSLSSSDSARKGLELIYSNMLTELKKEGLSQIETDGQFDPYKHEILMTKESTEKPGSILEVVRKGYMLNDILLRPAAVIVANEKKKDDAQTKQK